MRCQGVNEPDDGPLVFLGQPGDLLKLFPQPTKRGLNAAPVSFDRLDAQQLIGGDVERLSERDDGRRRRITGFVLVVRDSALGGPSGHG